MRVRARLFVRAWRRASACECTAQRRHHHRQRRTATTTTTTTTTQPPPTTTHTHGRERASSAHTFAFATRRPAYGITTSLRVCRRSVRDLVGPLGIDRAPGLDGRDRSGNAASVDTGRTSCVATFILSVSRFERRHARTRDERSVTPLGSPLPSRVSCAPASGTRSSSSSSASLLRRENPFFLVCWNAAFRGVALLPLRRGGERERTRARAQARATEKGVS